MPDCGCLSAEGRRASRSPCDEIRRESKTGSVPILDEDLRWEDQEQAVLSACSSLITIIGDMDSMVVQFSHFSVKEFLTSDRLATSNVV